MKVFILAAGMGTRLGDLTGNRPKALVKVNGTELLALTILRLKEQGFDEFVINIHHFGQMIVDFLKENHNFGVSILISDEREQLLDTGGALLKAGKYLDGEEPILVHNVDVISEIDFKDLFRYHSEQQSLATLCVRERVSGRYLIFNPKMELKGWTHVKTGEFKWSSGTLSNFKTYAFSGIYVISPEFIGKIKRQGRFSIIDTWLEMAGKYKITGYIDKSEHWFDLGTAEKIARAELYFKNK